MSRSCHIPAEEFKEFIDQCNNFLSPVYDISTFMCILFLFEKILCFCGFAAGLPIMLIVFKAYNYIWIPFMIMFALGSFCCTHYLIANNICIKGHIGKLKDFVEKESKEKFEHRGVTISLSRDVITKFVQLDITISNEFHPVTNQVPNEEVNYNVTSMQETPQMMNQIPSQQQVYEPSVNEFNENPNVMIPMDQGGTIPPAPR